MYKFLIIDDEPVVREGISENIDWQAHGFTLIGACRDGREGIQAIEQLHPDVVLTDICMPFVDGLDLAAFIADRYPKTKTILLTGYDEFEYAQEAVKLKVNDFLLKPITADELRTVLDRVCVELDRDRRNQQDLDKLRLQLRESLPLLRERFLNRLIQGETDDIEVARKLSLLELNVPGPFFNVMVVDPDSTDSEDDLMSLAIQNAVYDAARKKHAALAFRTQKEQVVVLLSAQDGPTAVALALDCAEEVSERVTVAFNVTVSIGIGSPVTNLADIDESYRNARTALGQRLVLGPNQIVTAEQICGTGSEPAPRVEEQARARVIRELRSGTAARTETAIRELVALYTTSKRAIKDCHVEMQRLLADMLNAFESLGIHHSQIPTVAEDPFGRLGELKTLDSIEQWFCELQHSARIVLATRQEQHSITKALEAEEYVCEHFADSGLSLTRLCRALAISKSYFSPMFKAHTGMTFVEYLTNLRMQRAMELLTSTDLKSYEVAERVGFSDAHYFSLTFRKQTGVSPTEYRDSVRGVV